MKGAKSCQKDSIKTLTAESCTPMKKFSISRKNSIIKMTVYMPKVVVWPKTKSQGCRGFITSLSIVVWWGVSYSGVIQIHFCNNSVKTNGEVYRAMLNDVLPPVEVTVFVGKDEWRFRQDSAPVHKDF